MNSRNVLIGIAAFLALFFSIVLVFDIGLEKFYVILLTVPSIFLFFNSAFYLLKLQKKLESWSSASQTEKTVQMVWVLGLLVLILLSMGFKYASLLLASGISSISFLYSVAWLTAKWMELYKKQGISWKAVMIIVTVAVIVLAAYLITKYHMWGY